mmetsp:Transcript_46485/g.123448  ORF Transcript_46485/g.123448 Transcript_46485/m.123448 type:complete len:132 (-) Transcript_46485:29-424(-)
MTSEFPRAYRQLMTWCAKSCRWHRLARSACRGWDRTGAVAHDLATRGGAPTSIAPPGRQHDRHLAVASLENSRGDVVWVSEDELARVSRTIEHSRHFRLRTSHDVGLKTTAANAQRMTLEIVVGLALDRPP